MTLPDYSHLSRFSADAMESLETLLQQIRRTYPRSAKGMGETIRLLGTAARFTLPENGCLLNLKDYRPEFSGLLKLPYPCLTLEYRNNVPVPEGHMKASRSIILCWTGEHATEFRVESGAPDIIYFTHVWFDDEQGEWEPSPVAWGFSPGELKADPENGVAVSGFHHFPCHIEAYDRNIEKEGQDWLDTDLQASFEPLLEFCLTVNCQNVETARIEPPQKLNAKRAKSGKPPLDSYHVLLIPGERQVMGSESVDERNGPRVHWRRGHLRRLQDGRVIWVRHALVGNKELGGVTKEYRVESQGS